MAIGWNTEDDVIIMMMIGLGLGYDEWNGIWYGNGFCHLLFRRSVLVPTMMLIRHLWCWEQMMKAMVQ